ncbi:MAG: putative transcriptional regulator [Mycobacterium sp.]|nr:putative transcriptional regulator [Mycobacterium sp.]
MTVRVMAALTPAVGKSVAVNEGARTDLHCRHSYAQGSAVRCVIVDDSPNFLEVARSLLEREGITVVAEAWTGAEALRLVDELRPDVTLVDINLGGESGFELAERLHWHARAALVPVIMISAYAEQDIAEGIAASAAVGYIYKSSLSPDAIRDLLPGRGDHYNADPFTVLC